MTPEERDALIGYVAEIERFTLQYARQFEALKYLLLEQGVITADGIARAVRVVEPSVVSRRTVELASQNGRSGHFSRQLL